MTNNDNPRDFTEADAVRATEAAGISLPINDTSELFAALTAMLDLPVSPAELETALRSAYIKLPLNTPADLVKAYNLILDVKLGETGGNPATF
ncbi:hypothetical protein [Novosphingobium panipatense]|uniref:Uncharacterized protein n=1 Tax=Novosphingobium panipatense TaxID=428991 RepID=A0ABY1QNA7_9SPHN|nr:hypothetical protein [Novosphingobium panipatense]SMP75599.1 hypothetical protein SAMN06296065_108100 [Novosphingobium panipatense]